MNLEVGKMYSRVDGSTTKVVAVFATGQFACQHDYSNGPTIIMYDEAATDRFDKARDCSMDLVGEYFAPLEKWCLVDNNRVFEVYQSHEHALHHKTVNQRIVHMKEVVV